MLISSKLFIRHLSRKIVRIESAGEGAATEKSRAVIGEKKIKAVHELFLSAEDRVRSFDKDVAESSFLVLYLSLTSKIWLRPWV